MSQDLRICFDVLTAPKSYQERLALVRGKMWGPHAQLSVAFLEKPSPALRERIERFANEWTQHAGVTLKFGARPKLAQIRIAFKPGAGSWSHVGRDCEEIPDGEPTMNFGWLTDESADEEVRRVAIHEFGHALGCLHEHQSPAAGLKWNKPAVYAAYAKQGWKKEDVDHNLFELYEGKLTAHSDFDTTSIMIYPIPRELLADGSEVGWNTELSEMDKKFISQMYPK